MASELQWSALDFIHKGYWWKTRGILMLNISLLIPIMTSVVNGFDSSLLNGLQILPQWQDRFGHPQGTTLGILNSMQVIGSLTALPMTPFASDLYGRRGALFFGSIIMLAGVGLQAFAGNLHMFVGARFCIGFGLSFCQNAAPLLLIELSYPTQRGKISAIYSSCWYLGSIISAWVCYGAYMRTYGNIWPWRLPTIFQAFFPLIQILSVWFIPESPRWLVSKGREDQAAAILLRYHTNGSEEHDPLVIFEMAQIRQAIMKEEEVNKYTSYRSLFTTPGNRKRIRIILAIGVFSQWSGNGLVSYYLNLVLDGVGIAKTDTKMVINGCLQILNFFMALVAAMLIDFVGRRPLFIISNSGMFLIFSLWTLTTALYNIIGDVTAAKATIPLIFLFSAFYDLAYRPLLIAYALEILPFRIRAKGFAVMNSAIMVTATLNEFVNPWAIASIGWLYYIVYCIWLIVELLFVAHFIVETKGRTLEETAALFDAEEWPLDLVAVGGRAGVRPDIVTVIMPNRPLSSVHLSVDKDDVTDVASGSYHYHRKHKSEFYF